MRASSHYPYPPQHLSGVSAYLGVAIRLVLFQAEGRGAPLKKPRYKKRKRLSKEIDPFEHLMIKRVSGSGSYLYNNGQLLVSGGRWTKKDIHGIPIAGRWLVEDV